MSSPPIVVTADPLPSRSGAIQAVVNIEIGRGNIAYINVIPGLEKTMNFLSTY